MSATFAAPMAAVLLAVELLLFELKPRSLIPVALASAAGGGDAPLPPGRRAAVPGPDVDIPAVVAPAALLACALVVGLAAGVLSAHADRGGLRRRGRCSPAATALDVVAGARRPRRRPRRAGLSRRRSASATTNIQALLRGGVRARADRCG